MAGFKQYKNYVPHLVLSNGLYDADGLRIELDLMAEGTGITLEDYVMAMPQLKGGGLYSASILSDGRRLKLSTVENVTETMSFAVKGTNQDDLINFLNDLQSWIDHCRDYWVHPMLVDPVYLEAQAGYEGNRRYSILYNMSLSELTAPYTAPFELESTASFMTGLLLTIERGPWLAFEPGRVECLSLNGAQGLYDFSHVIVDPNSPSGTVYDIQRIAGDELVMVTNNNAATYYSSNDASSWVLKGQASTSTGDHFRQIRIDGNGDYWAIANGTTLWSGIYKSTDDGANWTQEYTNAFATTWYDILINSYTGQIVTCGTWDDPAYPGANGFVVSTDDGGTTWLLRRFYGGDGFTSITETKEGLYVMVNKRLTPGGFILRSYSMDAQDSWYNCTPEDASAGFTQVYRLENAAEESKTTMIIASAFTGDGTNSEWWFTNEYPGVVHEDPYGHYTIWYKHFTMPSTYVNCIIADRFTDDVLYCGTESGEVWKSLNYGWSWFLLTDDPTGAVRALIQLNDGSIFIGGATQYLTVPQQTEFGHDPLCGTPIPTGNQIASHNITDVTHYDLGTTTYTDLQPAPSAPYDLFPSPAVGDIVYFGVSTDTPNEVYRFSNLVFEIVQPMSDVTLVWEYWSGSWSSFTPVDGTEQFALVGLKTVNWDQSADLSGWAETSVNTVNGWWIRARISVIGSNVASCQLGDHDVYTQWDTCVEMTEGAVGGTTPALAQLKYYYSGSSSYALDRFVVGSRALSRGTNFKSRINVSDVQLVPGIDLTISAVDATWIDNIYCSTGRLARLNLTSAFNAEIWRPAVTIQITSELVQEYLGVYRAFVKYHRYSGTAEVKLRMFAQFGSGGIPVYTNEVITPASSSIRYCVADFGQITVPSIVSASTPSRIPDNTTIGIQWWAETVVEDLDIVEIILIPVDEWASDTVNPGASIGSTSFTSASVDPGEFLEIDSCMNPRYDISAFCRDTETNAVVAQWETISNGSMVLQHTQAQALHVFPMLFTKTPSDHWQSPDSLAGNLSVNYTKRYSGLRGDS